MELIVAVFVRSRASWHPSSLCSCSIRWSKLSTGKPSWLLHSRLVHGCRSFPVL